MFSIWSLGLNTNRDAWMYGSSRQCVQDKAKAFIDVYNAQLGLSPEEVCRDEAKIKWSSSLEQSWKRNLSISFQEDKVVRSMYRPFYRQYVYYDSMVNHRTFQMPKLFPLTQNNCSEVEGAQRQAPLRCLDNICIVYTGGSSMSCLVSDSLPDLHFVGDSQCFPLFWYEEHAGAGELLGGSSGTYIRHDAITGEALSVFRDAYSRAFPGRFKKDGGEELNKEDIFYYIYGILHSPEYRERFASNLKKELPRIPLAADFEAFSRAGRELAHLHLDYESIEPWAQIEEDGDSANPGRTVKMTFGKCKKSEDNPKGQDVTVLHVAENMTLRNIPPEAYEYVVNGRSAIGWLMDRYRVRKDNASGIVNDPNDYSDDPRYIVDLVERVVTVSMETIEIVKQLPPLHEKSQPVNWPTAWRTV